MLSKKNKVRLRKFHRYLAVFIGIQFVFWVVSGIYFAWVPLETVRGRDRAAPVKRSLHPKQLELLLAPRQLDIEGDEIFEIRLEANFEGSPFYVIKTNNRTDYRDANTGESLANLTNEQLRRIALQDYSGEVKVLEARLVSEGPPSEYKGPLPVVRVSLDDWRETRLYLQPQTGQLLSRRNNFWRLFDFLWMLHILDFDEREDFNNPLLRVLTVASLVVVLSGYLLFYFSSGRRIRRKT